MEKVYTKSRLDGAGAVINEEIFVLAHCVKKNLEYAGAYGFNSTIPFHFQNHFALCEFLNLPLPMLIQPAGHPPEIKEEDYSSKIYPDINKLLDTSFINLLRSKLPISPPANRKPQIAVHIRRGDVKTGNSRYTPNAYYIEIIKKIKEINPNVEISIFSQSESSESFDEFVHLGCNLQLDKNLVLTWKEMILADVLVMSKGSFSYVPAIYNSNFVIFQPAWYQKLTHWHSIEDPSLWSKVTAHLNK